MALFLTSRQRVTASATESKQYQARTRLFSLPLMGSRTRAATFTGGISCWGLLIFLRSRPTRSLEIALFPRGRLLPPFFSRLPACTPASANPPRQEPSNEALHFCASTSSGQYRSCRHGTVQRRRD